MKNNAAIVVQPAIQRIGIDVSLISGWKAIDPIFKAALWQTEDDFSLLAFES